MTISLIQGNALALPIADSTVDLCVTSPPYFGLRSYIDAGVHYPGQLGSEATPAEFVDALIAATREMMRVLKPSGSIWVNLGDKYAGSAAGGTQNGACGTGAINDGDRKRGHVRTATGVMPQTDIRPKSLIGIPWRYALRCIDDLGLILRAEVIWSKPNGLPESVTDRVRRSHETWLHFTKEPRYFSAVDEIREAHLHPAWTTWNQGAGNPRTNDGRQDGGTVAKTTNPLGKLPGSVWTVPTQPLIVPPSLGVDHFAAFPMEWPRRIIRGWSPSGVCTACGEGRRPVMHDVGWARGKDDPVRDTASRFRSPLGQQNGNKEGKLRSLTGYACACPDTSAPTTPARILDPFGGTGTTALVAHVLGRHGISVDMSADYCRLARWRTTDPGQLASAAQVEKPPVECDGQEGLFDMEASA